MWAIRNAKNFFSVLGVTFAPNDGKGLAWNDRAGELIVRGTLQDLETIEADMLVGAEAQAKEPCQ